jgi:hypothetical protein
MPKITLLRAAQPQLSFQLVSDGVSHHMHNPHAGDLAKALAKAKEVVPVRRKMRVC